MREKKIFLNKVTRKKKMVFFKLTNEISVVEKLKNEYDEKAKKVHEKLEQNAIDELSMISKFKGGKQ